MGIAAEHDDVTRGQAPFDAAVLRQEGDGAGALAGGQGEEVFAIEQDVAGRFRAEAEHGFQQRGLAGAVGADEADEFAGRRR